MNVDDKREETMKKTIINVVRYALVSLCSFLFIGSAIAVTDEFGLTPKHWYAFNGSLTSFGETALSIGGESGSSYFDGVHGKAYKVQDGSCHPYGSGVQYGNGAWSIVTVAKAAFENSNATVFWATGVQGDWFGLLASDANTVKVAYGNRGGITESEPLVATVSDATVYHVYVIVYDGNGGLSLYVDGVLGVSKTGYTPKTNGNFQWGAVNGGLPTGLSRVANTGLDDWRLYQQALTAAQIQKITSTFVNKKTPRVIAINFNGGGDKAVASGDSFIPGYAIPAAAWTNTTGASGSSSVAAYDTAAGVATDNLATVMWACNTVWNVAGAGGNYFSDTIGFMRGYLDDGEHDGIGGVKITVKDVPFEKYDVLVFSETDWENAKFLPITVIDGSGSQVLGADGWGYSLQAAPMEGVNYLSALAKSGDVTIQAQKCNGNNRGCIAAVVLIENTKNVTLTMPTDWSEIDWGDVQPSADKPAEIIFNGGSLNIDEDVECKGIVFNGAVAVSAEEGYTFPAPDASSATSLTVNAGTIEFSKIPLNNITIAENATLKFDVSEATTINGISGTGKLVKTGNATLTFNNGSNGCAIDGTTIDVVSGTVHLNCGSNDAQANNATFVIGENASLTQYGWCDLHGTTTFDYSGSTAKNVFGSKVRTYDDSMLVKRGTGTITFSPSLGEGNGFKLITVEDGAIGFGNANLIKSDATFDFTKHDKTSAAIAGNFTFSSNYILKFPRDLAKKEVFPLCTGTLAASERVENATIYVGEERMYGMTLLFDATAKTVAYDNPTSNSVDENGIVPKHWYKFDGSLDSYGESALKMFGAGTKNYIDSCDGKAFLVNSEGWTIYGEGWSCENGAWTLTLLADVAQVNNYGAIWTSGIAYKGNSSYCGLFSAKDGDGVVFAVGDEYGVEELLFAQVDRYFGQQQQYHFYTVVYDGIGTLKLYIDGVCADECSCSYNPIDSEKFELGSIYGGYRPSDVVRSIGTSFDDLRFYRQALTDEQILKIAVSFGRSTYTEKVGDYTWSYIVKDGKAIVQGKEEPLSLVGYSRCVSPASGDIVVPKELGGFPVVSIGIGAFCGCEDITSIDIPEGIVSIERMVFSGLSLSKLVFPKSLELISTSACWQGASIDALYFSGNCPVGLEEMLFEVFKIDEETQEFLAATDFLTIYVKPGTTGWELDGYQIVYEGETEGDEESGAKYVNCAIAINFGASDFFLDADEDSGALEGAIPGRGWLQVGEASSDVWVDAVVYDMEKGAVVDAAPSPQIKWISRNLWQWSSATNKFLKGYLDDWVTDEKDGLGPQINIRNIPFPAYDLTIYTATDTPDRKFFPLIVNGAIYSSKAILGTQYSYVDGYTFVGNTNDVWGASQTKGPKYGTNALRIHGLSGDATISEQSGVSSLARGGIAAIVITPTEVDRPFVKWDGDFGMTTKEECTLSLEGNFVAEDGSYIEIDSNASKGVQIDIGGHKGDWVSALIRYSKFDFQSTLDNAKTLISVAQGGDAGGIVLDDVGIYASSTNFCGYYNNESSYAYGPVEYLAPDDGYLLFSYDCDDMKAHTGIRAYFGEKNEFGEWTWSPRIGADGLRFSNANGRREIQSISIGGPKTSTMYPALTGFRIESVELFDRIMTTAQAQTYVDVGAQVVDGMAARVGDNCYPTLAEAIDAANDGDVVKMLADGAGGGIIVDKALTIDFNGHTYTVVKDSVFLFSGENDITLKNGVIGVANDFGETAVVRSGSNFTLRNMAVEGLIEITGGICDIGNERSLSLAIVNGDATTLRLTATDSEIDNGVSLPLAAGSELPKVELADGAGVAIPSTGELVGNEIKISPVSAMLTLSPMAEAMVENSTSGMKLVLRREGYLGRAMQVAINVDREQISAPEFVEIPAKSSSTIVTITPVDNDSLDGNRHLTITATADCANAGSCEVVITDNEVPSLSMAFSAEELSEGGATISVTISRDLITNEPLTVYLTGVAASRCTCPSSVTIPAGEESVTFEIVAIDDDVARIAAEMTLRASAAGYNSSIKTFLVKDDDVPGVILTLAPEVVSEGAGPQAIYATLTRSDQNHIDKAVRVKLTPSLTNQLIMPSEITIPKYTMAVRFAIGVIDNGLDDGDREVTIDGAIVIESCGCSGQPSNGDVIKAVVGIIDNDGPALSLTASPSTMKEGLNPAGYLVLSHNSVLNEDLVVKLWIDEKNANELAIPETATIPAGQTSVRIPVQTLDDGVEDGGQLVSIYADDETGVFAPASTWVQVSDQNLPDMTVGAVATSQKSYVALEQFDVTFEVKNIGFASRIGGIPYQVHVVKGASNGTTSSSTLVKSGRIDAEIPPDGVVTVPVTLSVPEMPADYRVSVILDSDDEVKELDDANNAGWSSAFSVSPAYTATVSAAQGRFMPGDAVVLFGDAVCADGMTAAANIPVEIYVLLNGTRRTLDVMTDETGRFAVEFHPIAGEAGHYVVGASYPGVGSKVEQASFDIVGMKYVERSYLTWDMTVGEEKSQTATIRNLSAAELTGLQVEIVGCPQGCEIDCNIAENLAGNGSVKLNVDLKANEVSSKSEYEYFKFLISSAEGLTVEVPAAYYARSTMATLAITPSFISGTMTIDKTKYLTFSVMNTGKAASGKVTVVAPKLEWMKVVGGEIENLEPGARATVTLELSPKAEHGLVIGCASSGYLSVNCENGTGARVNLALTPVSEATGTLNVAVADENTYYLASEPFVANATVALYNYYTGDLVRSVKTGDDGRVTLADIPEGTYRLSVSADKHGSDLRVVSIEPGTTTGVTVFLQCAVCSYSWNVVHDEVMDTYEIKLLLDYETKVPAPVIKATISDALPDLAYGESFAFTITLENIGLIRADNVRINFPKVDGCAFVTPADVYTIDAGSVVVVPVVMACTCAPGGDPYVEELNDTPSGTGGTSTGGNQSATDDSGGSEGTGSDPSGAIVRYAPNAYERSCAPTADVQYEYMCGSDHKMHSIVVGYRLKRDCTPNNYSFTQYTPSGFYWNNFGPITAPSLGSGGNVSSGEGEWTNPSVPAPVLFTKTACDPYVEQLIRFLKMNADYELIKSIVDLSGDMIKENLIENIPGMKCPKFIGNMLLTTGIGSDEWLVSHLKFAEGYFDSYRNRDTALRGIVEGLSDAVDCVLPVANKLKPALKNEKVKSALDQLDVLSGFLGKVTNADGKALSTLDIMSRIVAPYYNAQQEIELIEAYYEESKVRPLYDLYVATKMLQAKYNVEEAHIGTEFSKMSVYETEMILRELADGALASQDGFTIDPKEVYEKWIDRPEGVEYAAFENIANRWNDSARAFLEEGVAANGGVDFVDILNNAGIVAVGQGYVEARGFSDAGEMLLDAIDKIKDVYDGSAGSVCASVSFGLSQTVTMTREAFRGTLALYNGHSSIEMKDIRLQVKVMDEDGNVCNELFGITDGALSGIDGASIQAGGCSLVARKNGSAEILFVPTINAAIDKPKTYNFGAILTYIDPFSGDLATIEMTPVALSVNPCPYLHLDYFVQRDVYGDNPFTQNVIEDCLPAEIALLVRNNGYGVAKNVTISAVQPEVFRNDKGEQVSFRLSDYVPQDQMAINGATKHLDLTSLNLGSIAGGESMVAQWWLTSSLEGHFVGASAAVVHADTFGNPATSLIDERIGVHKLIRSVSMFDDGLPGFLTSENSDLYGMPDTIFTSAGDVEVVRNDAGIGVDGSLSGLNSELRITIVPKGTGWNYAWLALPGVSRWTIESVTRADGSSVSLRNIWITDRVFRDGLDPLYEDRIHVIDCIENVEPQTYVVLLKAKPTDLPEVVEFGAITAGAIENSVRDSLEVVFSKPINPDTFTQFDVSLVYQGERFDDLSCLSVSEESETRFMITGLSAICNKVGRYELTVQCAGIADLDGNLGTIGKAVSWTYLDSATEGPIIVREVGLSGDKFYITFPATSSQTTVTLDDVRLICNGVDVQLPESASIAKVSDFEYVVFGLDVAVTEDGIYSLSVGAGQATWTVDRTPPLPATELRILPDEGISADDGITCTRELVVSGGVSEDNLDVIVLCKYVGGDEIKLADAEVRDRKFTAAVVLPGDGNMSLIVRSIDAAGNFSDAMMNIYVDAIPLTCELSGAPAIDAVANEIALTFDAEIMANDLTMEMFSLTRDGVKIALSADQLLRKNDKSFVIVALESICADDGQYLLTFASSDVRKRSSGLRSPIFATLSWQYVKPDREPPMASAVMINGVGAKAEYEFGFSTVEFAFSESVNIPELIDNGLITKAVRAGFAYLPEWRAADNKLILNVLDKKLPRGNGAIVLDAALIRDIAGNGLASTEWSMDGKGTDRFGGWRQMAKVDGYAMPSWHEGTIIVGYKTNDNEGVAEIDGQTLVDGIMGNGCQGVSVCYADWDGDGTEELFVGEADGRITLRTNGGEIEIRHGDEAIYGSARAVLCAFDEDDDGIRESIVVGGLDGRFRRLWRGVNDAVECEWLVDGNDLPIIASNGRSSPTFADLNHDGNIDLLTGDTKGNVWLYYGNGGSWNASPVCLFDNSNGLQPDRSRVAYGDVDKDGIGDLIVGRSDGSVVCASGLITPSPSFGYHIEWRFEVAFDLGEHGTRTGGGELVQSVAYGESAVSPEVEPELGYRFLGWSADFSDVQSDLSIIAQCEPIPLSIGEAVEAGDLIWTTCGDGAWFGEWNANAVSNSNAARSGRIADAQESVLAVSVSGRGVFAFDWKSSCQLRYDAVRLEVDGELVRQLSGITDWTHVAIDLGGGDHKIRWIYRKDRSVDEGDDSVWIDNVCWISANVPTFAEALNYKCDLEWKSGGVSEWEVFFTEAAYEGGSCAVSGEIGDLENSWIETTVNGAGRLEFAWATSCEEGFDWFDFTVDGEAKAILTGETGWRIVRIDLGEGLHTLRWEYWKDGVDDEVFGWGDCAMLDYVRWIPAEEVDEPEFGKVNISEFYEWLRMYRYVEKPITEISAKEMKLTVSCVANTIGQKGVVLLNEFIAGTDPTNPDDKFTASITFDENDKPIIGWSPVLKDENGNYLRKYTVYGKSKLNDVTWTEVKDDAENYNFFKVTVEMP